MKKNILLLCRNSFIWALCYTAIFAVSRTTLAYFSDSATSTGSVVTATIPSPTQIPIPKIVINEVFAEGGQSQEWIELYNSGNTNIDLANWKIKDNSSGPTTETLTTSSSILPAGSYALIVGGSFNTPPPIGTSIFHVSGVIGNGISVTDQILLLDSSNSIADQLSYGATPGIVLPYFPSSPGPTQSIIRFPNGTDTNSASDFSISSHPTFGTVNQL